MFIQKAKKSSYINNCNLFPPNAAKPWTDFRTLKLYDIHPNLLIKLKISYILIIVIQEPPFGKNIFQP